MRVGPSISVQVLVFRQGVEGGEVALLLSVPAHPPPIVGDFSICAESLFKGDIDAPQVVPQLGGELLDGDGEVGGQFFTHSMSVVDLSG